MGVFAGPEIIDSGLILHLDAGNARSYPGSGTTWFDLSGLNNNATISGTSVWNNTYGGQFDFGNVGQTTQYITLPHQAAQSTGTAYTMEFWMRPLSVGPYFFCSMASGASDNYFLIQQNSDSIQRWSSPLTTNTVQYSSNEIFQFCIVRNGSDTGSLYKNGSFNTSSTNITQINAVSNNGWILNQEQDSIGGGFDSAQNYRGAFMIIRLYNRALSTADITRNFYSTKGRFGL